jgi:hypothetical protein
MQAEELEQKLLTLLSTPRTVKTKEIPFIEPIEYDIIHIHEKEEPGKLSVFFKNGAFIRFSGKLLSTNKFIQFFNSETATILRRTCDGIFLLFSGSRVILCLVELKKNINNNFEKAVQQIEGSYLKTAMLLSLITNVKNLELVVFFGGGIKKDDSELDYLEKIQEISENPHSLEAKLKQLIANRNVRMDFPFSSLSGTIDQYYQKKDTVVYHLKDGETFDMGTIWNDNNLRE